jgi:hypothetical protein
MLGGIHIEVAADTEPAAPHRANGQDSASWNAG